MSMTCRACEHPERDAIDHAITSGVSARKVASKYGLSEAGISRHKVHHLSAAIAKVDAERGNALHARVEGLIDRADAILTTAEQSGRVTVALGAIREMRSLLELLGKATGELDDRPTLTVNLQASPEWLTIRGAILEALAAHPEARTAVAMRLAALSGPVMVGPTEPRLVGSSLRSVGGTSSP